MTTQFQDQWRAWEELNGNKQLMTSGDLQSEEESNAQNVAWSALLDPLTRCLLRFGFGLSFLTLLAGFVVYYGHSGTGVFTFDLFATPEALRTSSTYSQSVIVIQCIALVGALQIAAFQMYTQDDSKQPRGYRSGTKMLSTAATLDVFVIALRLTQHFYAYNFLGTRWWMRYAQSNTDWCLFYSSALLQAIALLLYGMAIFYMESYHDEGTDPSLAWLCFCFFAASSCLEVLLIFGRIGALVTVVQALALGASTVWAFRFESVVLKHIPAFYDTNVHKGIELPEASKPTTSRRAKCSLLSPSRDSQRATLNANPPQRPFPSCGTYRFGGPLRWPSWNPSLSPSCRRPFFQAFCQQHNSTNTNASQEGNAPASAGSPGSNAGSVEALRTELNAFCDRHNIPAESRPRWTTRYGSDVLEFRLPPEAPIDAIVTAIADYRNQRQGKHLGFVSALLPNSDNLSPSPSRVSIEKRRVNGVGWIRLDIAPVQSVTEGSTVMEFRFPRLGKMEASVEPQDLGIIGRLSHEGNNINLHDIHAIELALYLGHVNPGLSPQTNAPDTSCQRRWTKSSVEGTSVPSASETVVWTSPNAASEDPWTSFFEEFFFNDPFFSRFGNSRVSPLCNAPPSNGASWLDIDDPFGVFSGLGVFGSEGQLGRHSRRLVDDQEEEHHGIAGFPRQGTSSASTPQTHEHRIKAQLEAMGALVYLPSDSREHRDWSDLAGCDNSKRLIEETLLLALTHPDVFDKVTETTRGKPGESNRPRMILFNGPPGTGKTSTARIIASIIKLPLIYVSLECIVSKWFGESEKNLSKIFDLARALGQTSQGCVIFVDEIDSLATSRDDHGIHEASRRMLSILLRRLDGFDTEKDKTILICATNRERDLDEAFRSRVDVTVSFPLPSHEERKQIIQRYAKHLKDEELDLLAMNTTGLSGRNIRDFCQIAERHWVAELLRKKNETYSTLHTDTTEASTDAKETHSVSALNRPLPGPPVEYYLGAALEKQKQQA